MPIKTAVTVFTPLIYASGSFTQFRNRNTTPPKSQTEIAEEQRQLQQQKRCRANGAGFVDETLIENTLGWNPWCYGA
jgi:hypothetical protein